jgi:hypothetical protein
MTHLDEEGYQELLAERLEQQSETVASTLK